MASGTYRDPGRYEADDRGNVVDIYDASGKQVGRIDREATVDGVPDRRTFEGSPDVEAWAIANGYDLTDAKRI